MPQAKDYSYLEGKVIDLFADGEKFQGLVVNADYYIGITIINVHEPRQYLMCYIGPKAPNDPGGLSAQAYKTVWFNIVRQIEAGKLDAHKTWLVYKRYKRNALGTRSINPDNCPFRQ